MADQDKSNKLDVQSILKNFKNILPQNLGTPEPVDGDTLGHELAELSKKAKEAAKAHADLTQTLYDIESGINKLYADIEALKESRGEAASAGSTGSESTTANKVDTETTTTNEVEKPNEATSSSKSDAPDTEADTKKEDDSDK